jgi:hypothetical protein
MTKDKNIQVTFPTHYGVYYGGGWHDSVEGMGFDTINPANGEVIARVVDAGSTEVDRAVEAAYDGYMIWRDVVPLERARIMRAAADIFRRHADELALIESVKEGLQKSWHSRPVQLSWKNRELVEEKSNVAAGSWPGSVNQAHAQAGISR